MSVYDDLFEIQDVDAYTPGEGSGIDWASATPEQLAGMQQDPKLQLEYVMSLMEEGKYFGDREYGDKEALEYTLPGSEGGTTGDMYGIMEHMLGFGEHGALTQGDTPTFLGGPGMSISGFLDMDEEGLRDLLYRGAGYPGSTLLDIHGNLSTKNQNIMEAFGFKDWRDVHVVGSASGDRYEDMLGYLMDLQSGMGKLQGLGTGDLTTELGLVQRGVTGPGGLVSQKGQLGDELQRQIASKRQAYIPKEKTSRYSQLAGGAGAPDPTQGYVSGIQGDISGYEAGLGNIDKSIYDILYGTGPGSISSTYSDYGDLVGGAMTKPGGGLWFGS